MFIQVIRGNVTDADEFRRTSDKWDAELRPGAKGFLGGTGGVTGDGRFMVLARFESEAAARTNSERPEQGAWWAEMERCVNSVSFSESTDIVTMLGGANNDASFLQVMVGHVTDPPRLAAINKRIGEFESVMSKMRPDVIGEEIIMHADGTYTDVVYFTSEAAARAGEVAMQEPSPEAKAMLDELMTATQVDEYLDFSDPWMY
ncbi:MAG: hypothetical protein ABIQ73_15730 [Acidimicrobiales bacterium]